jgi:hypothetical protein
LRWFLCLLVLLTAPVPTTGAERSSLHGRIRDRETTDPLPSAHLRILGTTRGTITGTGGEYALPLEAGTYRVVASMLGYRPDTALVRVEGYTVHDVDLLPAEIVLPEVVVSSEDPAVEIIRRAIARKHQWMDRLASYQCEAFTRQVLWRDTAIASITESFTRAYWQQGDTLREVVRQRRQTANIDESLNFAAVGQIINFSEDTIRFLGYRFVGPTSTEALDYYDYKLLRTERSGGQDIFVIRMTPATRTVPLFDGTIRIADNTYPLMGVDVVPNDAFQIPFVKDMTLRYRQQFALQEDAFWLPIDIRISARATISFAGISLPVFGLEQTSVLSDYAINVELPDSIFRKPRLTVDSSATRIDSAFWAENKTLPLSPVEQEAYASLDSTQTLEVQFRPGGVAATLGGDAGAAGNILNVLDLSFNRVEGLHLGIAYDTERLFPLFSVHGGMAYGFSDKLTKYELGAIVYTSASRTLGFGVEMYRRLDYRPDQGYYGAFVNSLAALFDKTDYRDYHGARGWRGYAAFGPTRKLRGTLSVIYERHTSVSTNTSFSIFSPSRLFRENPSVTEGNLRSLRLDVRLGEPPVPFGLIVQNGLTVTVEHSAPGFASSSYDFTRYEVNATLIIPTFAPAFLFRPGFTVFLGAGTSRGALPLQRAFSLESALSGDGPAGVMRGMNVKEFGGTGYVALHAEHNFRSLPFLALGIPFLYENAVELVVHGGVARAWRYGGSVRDHGAGYLSGDVGWPLQPTDGWYSEAGFGINRVLDLFRADFTWRLSAPRFFRITLGIARII